MARLYGADALRYTLIASAGVGADIRLDHTDIEASFAPGRNFVNKLWNAGRFALLSAGDDPVRPLAEAAGELRLEDRWILSRQQRAIERTDAELEAFRIHGAAETLREFFWGEFADWYLEWVKPRLAGDAPGRAAARSVLVHVLDVTCRLLHPMVPFVTEELWGLLPRTGDGDGPLIVAAWPHPRPGLLDPASEARFEWLREVIARVRALRKEYRVGEGKPVAICVTGAPEPALLAEHAEALRKLARIGTVELGPPTEKTAGASAVLRDGTELFMPLAGIIDLEQERRRLDREAGRVAAQLAGTEAKLGNRNFVAKAPAAVVAREREKAASQRVQLEKLEQRLASLGIG